MNDRLHGHIFGTHGTLVGDKGGCKILDTPARLLKKLRSEDASVMRGKDASAAL